jgi:undecaprenyl-diphosphatase
MGLYFIMSLYQAIILAVVQGFTEFLPISSSAHLALAPWLLGWKDQGLAFDIALHFGTLLAVGVYFFKDWLQILGSAIGQRWGADPDLADNEHMLWYLAAGSIPIGVVGWFAKDAVETTLRSPWVIGFMLISVGLLMGWADSTARRSKNVSHVSLFDAVFIGVAQALAVVPGTSRSGITITAGLMRGFDRAPSARFSFLLSTPAIAAAAAKAFYDLHKAGGIPPGEQAAFFVGIAASAISGCFVISFFLRYLRRASLRFFVAYRIVFGILILALALFRRSGG